MRIRKLSESEKAEAALVFADSLRLECVRVAEEAAWTNWLASLTAFILRRPPRTTDNAVGLFGTVWVPRRLRTEPEDLDGGFFNDMAWLVHELTHVWQYQHQGPWYLARAIRVQILLGPSGYNYGGEEGLREATRSGRGWRDFNVEQQGEIARDFYRRIRARQPAASWLPFIEEMRRG
jgi:hypothetical protein